jgi:hypothetical protein
MQLTHVISCELVPMRTHAPFSSRKQDASTDAAGATASLTSLAAANGKGLKVVETGEDIVNDVNH